MTHKQIELSVVIPTYNEAVRIKQTIVKTDRYLKLLAVGYEIIVSDGQSPDNTATEVKKLFGSYPALRLVDVGPRIGKGKNVQAGLEAAQGTYTLFMDADLATPLHHIKTMLDYLRSGADVVIAERNLRKIHTGFREVSSVLSNYVIQLLVTPGITDTQCGFKGFSSKASKLCADLQTTYGWGFDFEYLLIARRNKLHLATFMVNDWYDPKSKDEGLVGDNTITAMIKTFWDLLKIKIKDITGAYSA